MPTIHIFDFDSIVISVDTTNNDNFKVTFHNHAIDAIKAIIESGNEVQLFSSKHSDEYIHACMRDAFRQTTAFKKDCRKPKETTAEETKASNYFFPRGYVGQIKYKSFKPANETKTTDAKDEKQLANEKTAQIEKVRELLAAKNQDTIIYIDKDDTTICTEKFPDNHYALRPSKIATCLNAVVRMYCDDYPNDNKVTNLTFKFADFQSFLDHPLLLKPASTFAGFSPTKSATAAASETKTAGSTSSAAKSLSAAESDAAHAAATKEFDPEADKSTASETKTESAPSTGSTSQHDETVSLFDVGLGSSSATNSTSLSAATSGSSPSLNDLFSSSAASSASASIASATKSGTVLGMLLASPDAKSQPSSASSSFKSTSDRPSVLSKSRRAAATNGSSSSSSTASTSSSSSETKTTLSRSPTGEAGASTSVGTTTSNTNSGGSSSNAANSMSNSGTTTAASASASGTRAQLAELLAGLSDSQSFGSTSGANTESSSASTTAGVASSTSSSSSLTSVTLSRSGSETVPPDYDPDGTNRAAAAKQPPAPKRQGGGLPQKEGAFTGSSPLKQRLLEETGDESNQEDDRNKNFCGIRCRFL